VGIEASPTEVRIEHSVAEQRALAGGFTFLYVVIVVVTIFRHEALLFAAFFTLFVAWWAWRIRRAQGDQPWLVVLTPAGLRHSTNGVDIRITRSEAGAVRLRRQAGPRMILHVLEVTGRDGAELLTVSLPGADDATMLEAAFEEWGWPVS
jgi:hypothetical protein